MCSDPYRNREVTDLLKRMNLDIRFNAYQYLCIWFGFKSKLHLSHKELSVCSLAD